MAFQEKVSFKWSKIALEFKEQVPDVTNMVDPSLVIQHLKIKYQQPAIK